MSLFTRFSSKQAEIQRVEKPTTSQSCKNDKTTSSCPYCSANLKKIPRAKTKCPVCGNFMYVRTRYSDRTRVVVTKQQADEIEEEWEVASMIKSLVRWYGSDYIKERDMLRKKFGKEPSGGDVLWSIFNNEIIKHTKNGDWGLYRNTRFDMAELLRGECRYRQALTFYLEVFYLDQNEVLNAGDIRDNSLEPQERVDTEVVNRIQLMSKKLGIDKEEVRGIYITHNQRTHDNLMLPITPEEAWKSLKNRLQ